MGPPPMGMGMGLGDWRGEGVEATNKIGSNNSIEFEKRLGEGVFGEVWKVSYKGRPAAAKVTQCPTGFRKEEIELLQRAQGPCTVRLIAQEEATPKGTALVMTLCEGSLDDKIVKSKGQGLNCHAKERVFLEDLAQVLEGLQMLHEANIIFGDLKPDNLLIYQGHILFSDFGDARDAITDFSGRSVHELGWGSPMYHARPDVLAQSISPKSDMWMLAQTAIHMWNHKAATTNPSPVPEDIPLRHFLVSCLSSSPAERPDVTELLWHIKAELESSPSPQQAPKEAATSGLQPARQAPVRAAQPDPVRRPEYRATEEAVKEEYSERALHEAELNRQTMAEAEQWMQQRRTSHQQKAPDSYKVPRAPRQHQSEEVVHNDPMNRSGRQISFEDEVQKFYGSVADDNSRSRHTDDKQHTTPGWVDRPANRAPPRSHAPASQYTPSWSVDNAQAEPYRFTDVLT